MASSTYEQDTDLPPPGSRWGSGAQSVLPYLTKTLQAKPAAAAEARDARNREVERAPDRLPEAP